MSTEEPGTAKVDCVQMISVGRCKAESKTVIWIFANFCFEPKENKLKYSKQCTSNSVMRAAGVEGPFDTPSLCFR